MQRLVSSTGNVVVPHTSFSPLTASGCHPSLLCSHSPCDTGSARSVLETDPEIRGFDFSLLTPDWTSKAGQFAADEATLNARAQWVRQWVRARPEKVILLVAHGDIIRRITGGPTGNSTHMWKNAEVQSFTFDPSYVGTDQAWLVPQGTPIAAGGWEPTSSDFAGKSGSAPASGASAGL